MRKDWLRDWRSKWGQCSRWRRYIRHLASVDVRRVDYHAVQLISGDDARITQWLEQVRGVMSEDATDAVSDFEVNDIRLCLSAS